VSSDHVLTVSRPQAAQQYLDAVPPPSGFQRITCPASSKPSVCFKRFPSVVLSDASWAEIIDHLGVPVTKSGCSHPRYLLPGHRTAVNCFGFGRLGREQIWLDATAVVLATRAGLRSTPANFGSFTGTTVSLVEVGS